MLVYFNLTSNTILYNTENIMQSSSLNDNIIYVGFIGADGRFSTTKLYYTGKWPNHHAYFRIPQNIRDKKKRVGQVCYLFLILTL